MPVGEGSQRRMLMLRLLLMVTSFANCAGGIVLIATWATMWEHVPLIVPSIGASLLIQGGYTILYLHGELEPWGEIPTGALLAGEGISACVGAGALVLGIIHNMNTSDLEMAPVLAGLLMLSQALLALLYLLVTDRVRPRLNGRSSP
jgi:hypothetical protein